MNLINVFTIFIISFFVSLLFIFIFKKLFYKLSILDNPVKYNKKRNPIPYAMWIIIFISFFIISYIFVPHNYKLYLIWFFWFVITLISFLDDLYNVSPKIRLVIQIIIWLIIWFTAINIGYLTSLFWGIDLENYYLLLFDYKIYFLSIFFTMIWYVFIFNSLNWSDWVEWNTAILSIIIFVIIALLWISLIWKDISQIQKDNLNIIITISVILIWILIPFFIFEYRQHMLMWDSWTMFLWFMVATLAIVFWGKIATVVLVFGIYIVDSLYVIFNRLKIKKNPLIWDHTHFHHRLLDIWFTKIQVIVFVWFFSFIFWLLSLYIDKIWKIFLFVFIIFFVIFSPKIINKFYKNVKK